MHTVDAIARIMKAEGIEYLSWFCQNSASGAE